MDDPGLPILRSLDPPAGGIDRLRNALDREERRSTRRPWLLAAATVATAAVIFFLVIARPGRREPMTARTLSSVVRDPTVASSESVAFYWTASATVPNALIEPPHGRLPAAAAVPLVTFGPPPSMRP